LILKIGHSDLEGGDVILQGGYLWARRKNSRPGLDLLAPLGSTGAVEWVVLT
jgi:hypothetical protein